MPAQDAALPEYHCEEDDNIGDDEFDRFRCKRLGADVPRPDRRTE